VGKIRKIRGLTFRWGHAKVGKNAKGKRSLWIYDDEALCSWLHMRVAEKKRAGFGKGGKLRVS